MESKWTTTISREDIDKWAIKKYGSFELLQEKYWSMAKTNLEEAKLHNAMDSQAILDDNTMLLFKEYLCDEVDETIIKVEKFLFDIRYDTYLVEYTREVK